MYRGRRRRRVRRACWASRTEEGCVPLGIRRGQNQLPLRPTIECIQGHGDSQLCMPLHLIQPLVVRDGPFAHNQCSLPSGASLLPTVPASSSPHPLQHNSQLNNFLLVRNCACVSTPTTACHPSGNGGYLEAAGAAAEPFSSPCDFDLPFPFDLDFAKDGALEWYVRPEEIGIGMLVDRRPW